MYKIIRSEKEAREYINAIGKMLKLFKMSEKFGVDNNLSNMQLKKVIDNIDKDEEYAGNSLKGKILREYILGEKSALLLAEEENYSIAHIYGTKQKILKEIAALVFEVIII